MRIASWNINSVRIRLEHIKRFCAEKNPDILCLQETKVQDSLFPIDELKSYGFDYINFRGEKSYNGVAILSKFPLSNTNKLNIAGSEETRHISSVLPNDIELHNFYIPAGGDDPDINSNPKFKFKLDFVDHMQKWFSQNRKVTDKIIILGDFNIAPLEHDVWSSKQLNNIISHTPIERKNLIKFMNDLNWTDVARHFVPHDEKSYSWWSYRNKDWQKSNRGRRLDHIWITSPLVSSLKSYDIHNCTRNWERPSDHIPIIVDLE